MADRFIKYNKILGKEASIGPIPANQIIPWILITIVSYLMTLFFIDLGLMAFLAVSIWGIASYWLLTGTRPYHYIDKWRNPPGKDWVNGNRLYISPLPQNRPPHILEKFGDGLIRIRQKPRLVANQRGGKDRFMPFQNFTQLCCMAEIVKDNRTVSAYLLELGKNQYQFVFAFEFDGIHPTLTPDEIDNYSEAFAEGFKYLPQGERISFFSGCYSADVDRQVALQKRADQSALTPVAVLLRNEQVRVRELSRSGSRRQWKQMVFVTWTSSADGSSNNKGFIANGVATVERAGRKFLGKLAGNTRIYQEQFYAQLFLKAYQEGFLQWELLLNTKLGLEVRPAQSADLWGWLWSRFNQATPPAIPQLLRMSETNTGYEITEDRSTNKHPVTVLIEGYSGESATPQHRQSGDTVTLPGLGQQSKCGVMVMEDPPEGWNSAKEQLRWVWKVMSSSFVKDTECFVELSPANNFLIQDNLARQSRSSLTASKVAAQKGQGRDVGAEIKQEESFEAQRKLYQGVRALNTGMVFLVYREDEEQLDIACNMLANAFDTAKMIRERNIAWHIWLQTLPITTERLLVFNEFLSSERRQTPDTTTVAGFLPLTLPKAIDRSGVELVTDQGGRALYIDLFSGGAKRMMVTGTSGSGKSVLVWRFALDALAQGIPVIGMDISSGGTSTFKTAIELLGDQGVYLDISRECSNLMEPPDLRKFDKEERDRRKESWKESILQALMAICIGKIDAPRLSQRVETLLKLALKVYLSDADIIDRYNLAFARGWKSIEWQDIPTLKDFKRFCTRERLNLTSFEEIDREALNQIVSQVDALLASPLGRTLGNPSTFNPEPMVKFFALSGLRSEQDSYLMAISAHAACIRNALSHPRSLFIGDELSVLLKKDGFASMIGEMCATGRKDGIAAVLIGQDPDSFYNCSAGSQIMQNMNYRLTGRITSAAALSFSKLMDYPPGIISNNATEAFYPKSSDLFSYWLVEIANRFWKVRFYPGEMMLASVANNQAEQEARARVMAYFPDTILGRLQALKEFAPLYCAALKSGRGFDDIYAKPTPLTPEIVFLARPEPPEPESTEPSSLPDQVAA